MTTIASDEPETERPRRVRRLSAILREIENRPEERITIHELAAAFGDRAFSAILLVFGLLTMAAIIPGTSTVTGAPLFMVATQMVMGRTTLWIPAKVGERTVRPADIGRLNARFLPLLRRMERLLVPRLTFLFRPFGLRIIGLVCLLLSTIIVLPIPGGNLAPGFSVALIAVAILTRDGLAVIAGVLLGFVSLMVLVLLYGGVGKLILDFFHWVAGGSPPPAGPDAVPGPGGPPPGAGPGGPALP